MTKRNQAVGGYGERCAVRHLIEAGLRPVARNWRCPSGEIDIVAWDGPVLVICEVKTRRNHDFGTPAEAVVRHKARRLRRLAVAWLAAGGRFAMPEQVLSVNWTDYEDYSACGVQDENEPVKTKERVVLDICGSRRGSRHRGRARPAGAGVACQGTRPAQECQRQGDVAQGIAQGVYGRQDHGAFR